MKEKITQFNYMLEEIVSPILIVTLGESTIGKTAYINKNINGNFENTCYYWI